MINPVMASCGEGALWCEQSHNTVAKGLRMRLNFSSRLNIPLGINEKLELLKGFQLNGKSIPDILP